MNTPPDKPTNAAIARLLGVHRSTVARWWQKRVPAERVLDLERTAGVSRHVSRPDLYPPPR